MICYHFFPVMIGDQSFFLQRCPFVTNFDNKCCRTDSRPTVNWTSIQRTFCLCPSFGKPLKSRRTIFWTHLSQQDQMWVQLVGTCGRRANFTLQLEHKQLSSSQAVRSKCGQLTASLVTKCLKWESNAWCGLAQATSLERTFKEGTEKRCDQYQTESSISIEDFKNLFEKKLRRERIRKHLRFPLVRPYHPGFRPCAW